MDLNRNIIEILGYLQRIGGMETRDSLKIDESSACVVSGKDILVRVRDDSISLFDRYDLQDKIVLADAPAENTLCMNEVKSFLDGISSSIVRLNHVGISYSCKNYRAETRTYAGMLHSKFKLLQEESDSENSKWYFIGDLTNWRSPIFELILNKPNHHSLDRWVPHFQIDVDTTLDFGELERRLKSDFGTGFDWSLEVPEVGIVLGMKILGMINGTKICLGTGTANKNTEYHRENLLKEYC